MFIWGKKRFKWVYKWGIITVNNFFYPATKCPFCYVYFSQMMIIDQYTISISISISIYRNKTIFEYVLGL